MILCTLLLEKFLYIRWHLLMWRDYCFWDCLESWRHRNVVLVFILTFQLQVLALIAFLPGTDQILSLFHIALWEIMIS